VGGKGKASGSSKMRNLRADTATRGKSPRDRGHAATRVIKEGSWTERTKQGGRREEGKRPGQLDIERTGTVELEKGRPPAIT